MKKIQQKDLKYGEFYLVFTGYDFSPSGYDIGEYMIGAGLQSQSNGDNLLELLTDIKIYKLPE